MTGKRPTGLFIAGTNTGVGKTFFAAALARTLVANGRRVGVYKPVLSGCSTYRRSDAGSSGAEPAAAAFASAAPVPPGELDDDLQLWQAAGCPGELQQVSPQRFQAPLAPHLAAQAEGRTVDSQLLRGGLAPWQKCSDVVIVEGAGGLFSPLTEDELNADLAFDFGFPIVLVAANALGVIHATLATCIAAQAYRGGLNVAAIVLNDLPDRSTDRSRAANLEELRRRCAPCPVFVHRSHASQVDGWESLFADRASRS